MVDLAFVILAAGKGTRMRSALPKVMHKVGGKHLLFNVIDAALLCNPKKLVVVTAPLMESVRETTSKHYSLVEHAIQHEQLGTGDAVKAAELLLQDFKGIVVVLCGDTPLVRAETILPLVELLQHQPHLSMAVLGMEVTQANAYGRLVVNKNQEVERIVETKDASDTQRQITTCNSGIMAVDSEVLFALLPKLQNKNASGEFYLTDLVGLVKSECKLCGLVLTEAESVMGVNSRYELSIAENLLQNRLRRGFMDNGVTLIDPETVYFSQDTKIAQDVIIHPNVIIGQGVAIAEGVEIKSFSHIEGAVIHRNAIIGPFARLRPKTIIEESAHVGNFVELKATHLGKGAKANHLSYLGDSVVGEKANIGAGTITCNYDGFAKHKTTIGKGAFIGSNTALVAPVSIGEGAIIAAGSVITDDVSENAMGIARSKQVEKSDWARDFRETKFRS